MHDVCAGSFLGPLLHPRPVLLRSVAAALVALAACARPDAPPAASTTVRAEAAPADTTRPLLGTRWRPVALDGDAPASLPGGGALLSVALSDAPWGWTDEPGLASLGGYDGCNEFSTGYTLTGDPAAPGGAAFRTRGWFSTTQACGPRGEHVSDRLTAGIAAARRLHLTGGHLVLTDSLGAERARFAPAARPVDRAAVLSGRWRLDLAASTVAGGALGPQAVAFTSDSTFAARSGCATFAGRYALDGDLFSLYGYDRYNAEACGPDGGEGNAIPQRAEVEADADRLVLYDRRDGRRAVYVRPD